MKDARRYAVSAAISSLFLGIALCMVANFVLYTHTHITKHGQLITHAHPFAKDAQGNPIEEGRIQDTASFLINALQTLVLLEPYKPLLSSCVRWVERPLPWSEGDECLGYTCGVACRAPPALVA